MAVGAAFSPPLLRLCSSASGPNFRKRLPTRQAVSLQLHVGNLNPGARRPLRSAGPPPELQTSGQPLTSLVFFVAPFPSPLISSLAFFFTLPWNSLTPLTSTCLCTPSLALYLPPKYPAVYYISNLGGPKLSLGSLTVPFINPFSRSSHPPLGL